MKKELFGIFNECLLIRWDDSWQNVEKSKVFFATGRVYLKSEWIDCVKAVVVVDFSLRTHYLTSSSYRVNFWVHISHWSLWKEAFIYVNTFYRRVDFMKNLILSGPQIKGASPYIKLYSSNNFSY